MRALSLFSGVGGLDLAAEAAGIEIAAMCEIEPFCRTIIHKRWPGVPVIEDVRTIRGEDYAGAIDIVFGGFPCQDLSCAGRQKGLEGERSGLWFEMLRVIRELRPAWVLAENVRGAVELALDTVRDNLEAIDYEVRAFVVPASAFGAPHRRERIFIVGARRDVDDACKERLQRTIENENEQEKLESADEQLTGCCRGDLWPTPTVNGNNNRAGLSAKSGNGLATAVRMWPTPRQQSSTGVSNHGEGGPDLQTVAGGQLNPDWVEQLMGFPEGWTNPDVDEPRPWQGWPAPMGARLWMTPQAGACGMTSKTTGRPLEKSTHLQAQVYCAETRMWGTPSASDYKGSHGGGQGKSLRTDVSDVKHGLVSDQYPYEFPRTVKGGKNRAARIKALGNAVVPQQAYPFFRAIIEMEKICGGLQ